MDAAKYYRIFLICSNVLLLFVGLTIFILGIKMQWALSVLLLINIPIVMKAVEALIATGFFISFSGITGICGASCENKWLLLMYLIFLGIIVIMEFSLGVTLMIVKKTVSTALETPDCNSVCSASIDAAILDYALPSAGLMMSIIFVEALMIYCSIKLYFYVRDSPKVIGPPMTVQDVQMSNVAGSISTYVRTPQPTSTSQFEYSPHHYQDFYARQVTGQVRQQTVLEEKPPDYDSLSVEPFCTRSGSFSAEGISENVEPKEMEDCFNRV